MSASQRYIVVSADTTDDLEAALNTAYAEGYMPVGSLGIEPDGGKGTQSHRFIQIMELRETHRG